MAGNYVKVTLVATNAHDDFPERHFTMSRQRPKMLIGRSSIRHAERMPSAKNAMFTSAVVSRQHAELVVDVERKKLCITDLGSMHGSSVNFVKLKVGEIKPLTSGDVITIGSDVCQSGPDFSSRKMKIKYEWHHQPHEVATVRKAVVPLPTKPAVAQPKANIDTATVPSTTVAPKQTVHVSRSPSIYVVPEESSEDEDDLDANEEGEPTVTSTTIDSLKKQITSNSTNNQPQKSVEMHRSGSSQNPVTITEDTDRPSIIDLEEDEQVPSNHSRMDRVSLGQVGVASFNNEGISDEDFDQAIPSLAFQPIHAIPEAETTSSSYGDSSDAVFTPVASPSESSALSSPILEKGPSDTEVNSLGITRIEDSVPHRIECFGETITSRDINGCSDAPVVDDSEEEEDDDNDAASIHSHFWSQPEPAIRSYDNPQDFTDFKYAEFLNTGKTVEAVPPPLPLNPQNSTEEVTGQWLPSMQTVFGCHDLPSPDVIYPGHQQWISHLDRVQPNRSTSLGQGIQRATGPSTKDATSSGDHEYVQFPTHKLDCWGQPTPFAATVSTPWASTSAATSNYDKPWQTPGVQGSFLRHATPQASSSKVSIQSLVDPPVQSKTPVVSRVSLKRKAEEISADTVETTNQNKTETRELPVIKKARSEYSVKPLLLGALVGGIAGGIGMLGALIALPDAVFTSI